MNGGNEKNIYGLCILAAAIFLGAFLVFRQMIALQRAKVELAVENARKAPPPAPLIPAAQANKETMKRIVEIPREVESKDMLEAYEQEDKRPGLLQVFRMGEQLPQKRVEGVEYVKSVMFRRQVGTGRVLADASLANESSAPVSPRFEIRLFNAKGKFLCRDTVLYIAEELPPAEKKIETLSLAHGPEGVAFYEVRKLE